ncbi:PTS fructose transporter subunit IIBC, partial [Pseudomonas syringae pv. tagetis]
VDLNRFVGKRLFQDSRAHALQDVEGFLQRAERDAQVHAASEATAPQATGGAGAQPRIVANTACPTGVAHTFKAAEAIQQA